jgi:SAM-dependent methyltransferase
MTTTTDIPRPRFARMYLKVAARADRRGAAEHRRRLLQDLAGRVLEVGAGNGLNVAHYPPTVTDVVAIEPEPTLRAIAQQAAAGAPVPVTVRAGTADALPLADGEMDAAVASLVLCSVPDQARALAELHRVLRPGGELRFYEHVIARCQPKRAILQLADHSGLWPAIGGGCHPARDTGAAIEAAGFTIERCERFGFRASALEPSVPHILGIARRP